MIDIDKTKIILVTFEIFVIMVNTRYCVYVSALNKKGVDAVANVRINVAVEEETHKALKILAASQGKSLKEIVLEALREKAKTQNEKKEV